MHEVTIVFHGNSSMTSTAHILAMFSTFYFVKINGIKKTIKMTWLHTLCVYLITLKSVNWDAGLPVLVSCLGTPSCTRSATIHQCAQLQQMPSNPFNGTGLFESD